MSHVLKDILICVAGLIVSGLLIIIIMYLTTLYEDHFLNKHRGEEDVDVWPLVWNDLATIFFVPLIPVLEIVLILYVIFKK
jgi:hypothetical protein